MVRVMISIALLLFSAWASANDIFISPTQSAEESAARRQTAETSFQNIIAPQNVEFNKAKNAKRRPMPAQALDLSNMIQSNTAPPPPPNQPDSSGRCQSQRTLTFSLDAYRRLKDSLESKTKQALRLEGPAVILGASKYSGSTEDGVLKLNLKLTVFLGAGDTWKTVPLIGEEVILADARVDGKTVPTASQGGYLVWHTQRTGEVVIDVDLLVPSRGPRGSIEYDFFAPKTPVTRFSCFFPVAQLEPRIADARQSSAVPEADGTRFEAVLKPTSRIHFVGYKDIGTDETAAAGLFTESMNLLSIDDDGLDLFSVFRYTILYAGAKEFHISIPKGMTVVSAEGESAFRFVLEEHGDQTLLKGETAFPVRNHFEISLRLKKNDIKQKAPFEIPLPRAVNARREHGWIAVESPGKLRIKEKKRTAVATVDVRQLPEEVVRSAVSPIILAYRFHSIEAEILLLAEKLPEKELASDSIDRVHATSVIAEDGKMLTDLRIKMRNRLLPSLSMTLPQDWKLLSAHLDGEAVRPNREGDKVILPLKRSVGLDSLSAFTLQVVLESRVDQMGLFGRTTLTLPAQSLPVSSAVWQVYMPAYNTYSALEGDVAPQVLTGEAVWHTSPFSNAPVRTLIQGDNGSGGANITSEGTGMAAVRIDLPKSGKGLKWAGYWIDADAPIVLTCDYVRSRLLAPVGILFVIFFVLGVAICFTANQLPVRRFAGGLTAFGAAIPIYYTIGITGLFIAVMTAAGVVVYRASLYAQILDFTKHGFETLSERYKNRDKTLTKITVGRVFVALGMGILALLLLTALGGLSSIIFSPL